MECLSPLSALFWKSWVCMTAQHRCHDPQDDCAAQTRLALWSSRSVQFGGAPLLVAYERYNSLCPVTVIFSLPLDKYCVIGMLKKSLSCLLLKASFQNRNGLKDWPNKWGLIQQDWISIGVSEWWRESYSEEWDEQKCWILPTCKAVFEKQTF